MKAWTDLREKDVVRQCSDYLQIRGWYEVNQPSGLLARPKKKDSEKEYRIRVGDIGCADKIYMKPIDPGYCGVFFCEFKGSDGRLSPRQAAWHRYMQSLGFRVVVIESLEQLVSWLKENF